MKIRRVPSQEDYRYNFQCVLCGADVFLTELNWQQYCRAQGMQQKCQKCKPDSYVELEDLKNG